MRSKLGLVAALFLISLIIHQQAAIDATAAADVKIYKIAYLENGPFWAFDEIMKATQKALESQKVRKEYSFEGKIEFPSELHFSPGWENEKKNELHEKAKELMERDDIDLIIVAGTSATAALLKVNNQKTPIISIGVSDPVKSKFVLNEKDSGVDNYTARVVPGRFKRMFQIFHDVVEFSKLGLLYPDTENGRKYSNVDDAYEVAQERGFKIIEYKDITSPETLDECMRGIQWLIDQGMDAFFIPALTCFDWKTCDANQLMTLLIKNKIPTFAREGTKFVKAGALMGFSSIDFSKRGELVASKIIRILKGEKPRSLPLVDNAMPVISLNIYVAEQIGVSPSFDILGASDEIFQEITLPEDRLVK